MRAAVLSIDGGTFLDHGISTEDTAVELQTLGPISYAYCRMGNIIYLSLTKHHDSIPRLGHLDSEAIQGEFCVEAVV